jgi:IS30 family transposase
LFDRNHGSIRGILGQTGGIRPAKRCLSKFALNLAEREEISRALVAGVSIRSIASQLNRAPSTVSREIKRNGGQGSYPIRVYISSERKFYNMKWSVDIGAMHKEATAVVERLASHPAFSRAEGPGRLMVRLD